MDSDNSKEFPFPILAIFIVFIISCFGFLVNAYLFLKFVTKPTSSTFQKLCLVKTVPNIIVCSSFLFWVIPLSLFPCLNSSRLLNVIIGQVAGAGAYVLGPLTQVCMASNRFIVLYFPLKQLKLEKSPATNIAITISIVIAVVMTAFGIPEECGYLYEPASFTWNPEPFDCAEFQLDLLTYIVVGLTLTSNSFNVITAFKLLCFRVMGVSQAYASKRRKRRVMLFVQSVVQDCLHLIDLINCTYFYQLSDDLWFQFAFLTVSFVLIYALDGTVMLYFHPEMFPSCLRGGMAQTKVRAVFTAASLVSLV